MKELGEVLIKENLSISSFESLTGGLFASELCSISGISRVFKGGVVCYQDEIKINVLKVSKDIVKNEGAVSEACVYQMVKNGKEMFQSDIAIAFSGNAGPLPSENKEVGLVYIGVGYKDEIDVRECHLSGNRQEIREKCLEIAKKLIFEKIF